MKPQTFTQIGTSVGKLVQEKNTAYGSSFAKAGDFLRLLFPDGIAADRFEDALLLVRIFDKQMRIATDKDAFGESPYQDIAGYGILGIQLHQSKKETAALCPGSASDQSAEKTSKAQPDSADSNTSAKTITSENAIAASETSQRPESSSAPSRAATAPTVAASASVSAVDQLNLTYKVWLQRHNNLRCIRCGTSVMGKEKCEVVVHRSYGSIALFTCSMSCWQTCLVLLEAGSVDGCSAHSILVPQLQPAPQPER